MPEVDSVETSQEVSTLEMIAELEAAPPRPVPIPIPRPFPFIFDSRFMIWKQDPSVKALGRRLTYIPSRVLSGPRDARINTNLVGTTPVTRSRSGDFLFPAGTPEADCAHTFAVVRQTLTLCERAKGGTPNPWAWNTGGNTDVITVFPRAFSGVNAFYSRGQKSLKFGSFTRNSRTVFTCRSLDIVSHECGHAILDGLKPGWLGFGNPPQTGGLHESFGDLASIFLALSQADQGEEFIVLSRANLHAKNFLSAVAEEFGAAMGRPAGLRNADNNLKLSQVSNEVHAISQVFTGGIYDVLADIFAFETYPWVRDLRRNRQRRTKGPAQVLLEVSQHLLKLLMEAIDQAPASGATYSDVVNKMLVTSRDQGDPVIYRTFLRNRFTFREVVVSPIPLTTMAAGAVDYENPDFVEGEDVLEMKAAHPDHPSLRATQDRSGCCGTMQHPEYAQDQKKLDADLNKLCEAGTLIPEEDLLASEVEELSKTFK